MSTKIISNNYNRTIQLSTSNESFSFLLNNQDIWKMEDSMLDHIFSISFTLVKSKGAVALKYQFKKIDHVFVMTKDLNRIISQADTFNFASEQLNKNLLNIQIGSKFMIQYGPVVKTSDNEYMSFKDFALDDVMSEFFFSTWQNYLKILN